MRMGKGIILRAILPALAVGLAAAGSHARTIKVNHNGSADFTSIKEAVNDANDGDCVIVADGEYNKYLDADVDFNGKAITVRSENGRKNCIINCRNSRRAFVFLSGEDANSVVAGFTIANCYGRPYSYSTESTGGAIYCRQASPKIVDCRFTGNYAKRDGGAVYVGYDSSPEFVRCMFDRNSATYGGAVNCSGQSNTLFVNCVFLDNTSTHSGAGVWVHKATVTLINCTFARNRSTYSGSALSSAVEAEVIMRNCILWNANNGEYKAIACMHSVNLYFDYCIVLGGQPNIFNNSSTVHWGLGNTTGNPHFAVDSYSLVPPSYAINAGDPNFVERPDDADIHGRKRVVLGRVDIGAVEYDPFKATLTVLSRRRIARTVFEYECEVSIKNMSTFPVSNVSIEMAACPSNVVMLDYKSISFGETEIPPGESLTGFETCTFSVDRSETIDPTDIIWHVTAEAPETLIKMNHAVSTPLPQKTADFRGLKQIADNWLWQGTIGAVGADAVPDGKVNLADFAIFAETWLKR